MPLIKGGAGGRLPGRGVPTSPSPPASSGSALWTRSTSSRSVVLSVYSTSAASQSSRCERLRSLIVSATGHLLGRDGDRQRHDACLLPGGPHARRLRGRGRERDAAVARAGTRRLRD